MLSSSYDYFFVFIHSIVYKCKSSLHSVFSYDEIVAFLYLIFEKHDIFNF